MLGSLPMVQSAYLHGTNRCGHCCGNNRMGCLQSLNNHSVHMRMYYLMLFVRRHVSLHDRLGTQRAGKHSGVQLRLHAPTNNE